MHCLFPTSHTLVSAVLISELPLSFTSSDKPVCVSREYRYPFWGDQGSQGTETQDTVALILLVTAYS